MQDRLNVFKDLQSGKPHTRLLYTTPEQLQASAGLSECLQDLHRQCDYVNACS